MDIDQIIDAMKQFSTSLVCLSLDLVHVFVGTDQFSFKTLTMSRIKMISTGAFINTNVLQYSNESIVKEALIYAISMYFRIKIC